MPIKRIAEESRPCRHSEHNPPALIALKPGTYEHICPKCKGKSAFSVEGIHL